ncbi:MAG: hypothetical protein K0U78_14945 [Actinomycetia bacterium]|nr:hypothetical protein [Actinomycetes bacterium]
MSHVNHTSMSVTSWDHDKLMEIREKLILINLPVTAVYKSQINGYSNFFVIASGSKFGWDHDIKHRTNMKEAEEIIDSYKYEDGSTSIDYCISNYGETDG